MQSIHNFNLTIKRIVPFSGTSTILVILFFLSFTMMRTTKIQAQELQTVPHVDLEKYAGKWYEIASFPQRFQKGCQYTTATYTLTDKDYVIVENRCRKHGKDGKETYVKAKALL